ncbi:hypothetical protein ACHAXT_012866 [Thalassiosira profunda]
MLPLHLQNAAAASAATSNAADPFLLDHLHHMLRQEGTHYQVTADYLSHPGTAVTASDRRTMASWSHDIVDACAISREVSCIAASYFDRFACTHSKRAKAALRSRRDFQLAFIACLVVALKCRAGMQVDSDFVSGTVCQGLYDEGEIVAMEREILAALSWRLNGPSAHEFIGGFLALLPGCSCKDNKVVEAIRKAAEVQAEAAVLEYSLAARSASSVAYAAVLTALQGVGGEDLPLPERCAWIKNIGLVTGVEGGAPARASQPYGLDRSESGGSTSSTSSFDSECDVRHSPAHPSPGYGYCSPANSAPGSPYLMESPICSMFDGRIDLR